MRAGPRLITRLAYAEALVVRVVLVDGIETVYRHGARITKRADSAIAVATDVAVQVAATLDRLARLQGSDEPATRAVQPMSRHVVERVSLAESDAIVARPTSAYAHHTRIGDPVSDWMSVGVAVGEACNSERVSAGPLSRR
jgi:hypothetical protein